MTKQRIIFVYIQIHLGSPIRLLGDSGIDEVIAYDEFGKSLTDGAEKFGNPFTFTGYQKDNVSGMLYAQNRYFVPEVGRFSAEDPIRVGLNWYDYCGGNPLRYFDPLGLECKPMDKFSQNVFEVFLTELYKKFTSPETMAKILANIYANLAYINPLERSRFLDGTKRMIRALGHLASLIYIGANIRENIENDASWQRIIADIIGDIVALGGTALVSTAAGGVVGKANPALGILVGIIVASAVYPTMRQAGDHVADITYGAIQPAPVPPGLGSSSNWCIGNPGPHSPSWNVPTPRAWAYPDNSSIS